MKEILVGVLIGALHDPQIIQAVSGLVATGVLAAAGWVLRRVPAQYLSEKAKADADHVVEASVHDLMDQAEKWKQAQDGKLTPEQKKQLEEDAVAKAKNIAEARGYELFKVLQPELVRLAITKAVERVKGVKSLPVGTAGLLPLLVVCALLPLAGCATFPKGWSEADPANVLAVQTAAAGFIHGGAESTGTDPALRDILSGAAKAAAADYRARRDSGADQNEAAWGASLAAGAWVRDHGREALGNQSLKEYIVARLQLPKGVSDAEMFLGLLRAGLEEVKSGGVGQ